jgi:hypothetical protein
MQRYTVFFITVNALHVSGGETAWNTQSIDSNKEYCITLHLVGYTWKDMLTMHGHRSVKSEIYVIFVANMVIVLSAFKFIPCVFPNIFKICHYSRIIWKYFKCSRISLIRGIIPQLARRDWGIPGLNAAVSVPRFERDIRDTKLNTWQRISVETSQKYVMFRYWNQKATQICV